jgi:pimeloyl-ACP methyl ester carboxylesterase
VYVGGSLGAYIGFYLLDKFQDKFVAAVLMDCGQNVGPGASLKARLGLVMMNVVAKQYSNADLMKLMVGVTKKSKADFRLVETCFGAGNFFEQGQAQVECLRTVAPAEFVGKVPFPILFMNGSEDHRDSERLWLELCQNKQSDLKVYEGGDHFFCHDTRFLDDILVRMHELATQKV